MSDPAVEPLAIRHRALVWMVVGAFLWRLAISALTPVPSEDGANYLWMAERFAAGDPASALGEVFPPLLSLAIAPWIALGLDPFRAGQLVCCLAGALTLLVCVKVTARIAPGGEMLAALLVIVAPLPARLCGEVYTEPMFHLVGSLALLSGVRGKPFEAGLWSGMAFWLRPEGLLVAVALGLVAPLRLPLLALGAAIPVLGLAMWRMHASGGAFELVPKLDFNAARLWGEAPGVVEFASHWGANALQIPWLWVEAFAVTGIVAVVALVRRAPSGVRSRDVAALRWMTVLAIAVVCAFLARRRFLVAWFFVVVPLAVVGLRQLSRHVRDVAVILAMISGVLLSFRIQDANRYAERVVGEYLATKLGPGEEVAGDMTRVVYFAGRRPLPPRHFTAEELIERGLQSDVRFVVLGERRATTPIVRAALEERGFREYDMPSEDREVVKLRGILILGR